MTFLEEKHTEGRSLILPGLRALFLFLSGVALDLLFLWLSNNGGQIVKQLTMEAALLVPLCIGIVAPLTAGNRRPFRIISGLGMSFLVLAGIAVCGLVVAGQADAAQAAYCASPDHECHVYGGGDSIHTVLTFLYLVYAALLIIPGALIMGLLLKKRWTKREG
jgi:hypothetical protein